MPSYPVSIRRCQYIKSNGTQCGSPALRDEKYCHFHMQWSLKNRDINMNFHERGTITLPTLEDANSIQEGLAEVMRLLVTNQIDHRTAALLLHALRTASVNIRHASFEPEPTLVVIDSECVERRPLGATAWSKVEGREYDEVESDHGAYDVPPPATVLFGAGGYAVPRPGRVLVGATVEHEGFDKSTTPEGLAFLREVAARLLPQLAALRPAEHWAGLRPGSRDGLPLLGRTRPGVVVATGHYRNGILLAPATAELVVQLVDGASPELRAFAPGRFRGAPVASRV